MKKSKIINKFELFALRYISRNQLKILYQFILYGFIGVFSASLDFACYALLIKFVEINYLILNFFSITIGITTSFILNYNFNFKVKGRVLTRFIKFYGVGLVGLFISTVFLIIGFDILHINILIVKIISIFVVVIVQFTLNKIYSFKK